MNYRVEALTANGERALTYVREERIARLLALMSRRAGLKRVRVYDGATKIYPKPRRTK